MSTPTLHELNTHFFASLLLKPQAATEPAPAKPAKAPKTADDVPAPTDTTE